MCVRGETKNGDEDVSRAEVKEKTVLLKRRNKERMDGMILWGRDL